VVEAPEPVVVAEEPVVVAEEPVVVQEPVPVAMAEEPAVVAPEGFASVEPSPFVAEPAASEEPVVEPQQDVWFVADVSEPTLAPEVERPAQSDTWSGRSVGS